MEDGQKQNRRRTEGCNWGRLLVFCGSDHVILLPIYIADEHDTVFG